MDWQELLIWLAPLRRQWDVAVLANMAAGTERPGDMIEAINAQAGDDRRIGWKVLNDTLRRLENSGYLARQEMPGVPRETRYRLRPPGRRLISALSVLDAWYDSHEPGEDTPGGAPGDHAAGDPDDGDGTTRIPARPQSGPENAPGWRSGAALLRSSVRVTGADLRRRVRGLRPPVLHRPVPRQPREPGSRLPDREPGRIGALNQRPRYACY